MKGLDFDGLSVVFDDDFFVVDFDDLRAVEGEFGVVDAGDEGAFDDDLVDGEGIGVDGEIDDAAEVAFFLCDDFMADEVEVVFEDF